MRTYLFLPLLVCSLASTYATTVCSGSQCLEAKGNGASNVGGTLGSTEPSTILLMGQYPSSAPSGITSALSSGRTIKLPSYLSISDTAATPILPFTIDMLPGMVIFPVPLFQGQPSITMLNSANTTNLTATKAGSVLLSKGVYAVFAGLNPKPVVLWDTALDLSQMPGGIAEGGSATVLQLQSTTCAAPCSAAGQCSAKGVCECKPGFIGASCEACAPGFFGPKCTECPAGCDVCDEGVTGTGRCLSSPTVNAPASCGCDNGTCEDGATCKCNPGWITPSSTTTAGALQCSECANGFFKSADGECRACGLGCAACSASTGQCRQCRAGYEPSRSDPTSCVVSVTGFVVCEPNEYPLTTGGCGTCSRLCNSCTGPSSTDCVLCSGGQAWLDSICVPVDSNGVCTDSGLIVDISKGKCDGCPKGCSSCSIPGFGVQTPYERRQCTGCLPGLVLSTGQCMSQCPKGQFVGADGLTCQPCDSTCGTCAGTSSYCLTCAQSGLYALDGSCVATCPPSTFSSASSTNAALGQGQTISGTCQSCHPDCQTCSGPRFEQCTSCPANRPVKTAQGRCLQACPRGQFWDDISSQCQGCTSGCASCISGASDMCLSCAGGMVLQKGRCIPSSCPEGASGIAELGGVCLATLAGQTTTVTTPGTATLSGATGRGGMNWWKFVVIAGCVVGLIILGLVLWRRRARKQRALATKNFKESLDRNGIRATNRITLMWDRMFNKAGEQPNETDARRIWIREQLRKSKAPGEVAFTMENVDLEVGERKDPAERVTEWREEVSQPTAQQHATSGSRASIFSDATEESDAVPEDPIMQKFQSKRRPRPTGSLHDRNSVSETMSVYSQATTAKSGRPPRIPVPRVPVRDSTFSPSQMKTPITTKYPPFNPGLGSKPAPKVMSEIDLLMDSIPQMQWPQAIAPMATGGTQFTPRQTPMHTGNSNNTTSSDQHITPMATRRTVGTVIPPRITPVPTGNSNASSGSKNPFWNLPPRV